MAQAAGCRDFLPMIVSSPPLLAAPLRPRDRTRSLQSGFSSIFVFRRSPLPHPEGRRAGHAATAGTRLHAPTDILATAAKPPPTSHDIAPLVPTHPSHRHNERLLAAVLQFCRRSPSSQETMVHCLVLGWWRDARGSASCQVRPRWRSRSVSVLLQRRTTMRP